MGRSTSQHRRTGALWLLVLALVSVLAPVWADTYVCPMAKKAAAQVKSCCAKTESARVGSIAGTVQFQPPCDCPKLSWSADAADQVRELRSGSDQTVAYLAEIPPSTVLAPWTLAAPRLDSNRPVHRFAPPLWRLHQSILC